MYNTLDSNDGGVERVLLSDIFDDEEGELVVLEEVDEVPSLVMVKRSRSRRRKNENVSDEFSPASSALDLTRSNAENPVRNPSSSKL